MNTEKVTNYIVNWLEDYANKANTNGFVVGVSGGIDSAVTSTLAAKTERPVLCLEMPVHQAESQVSQARQHIQNLQNHYSNVTTICTNLAPVFDCFVDTMPTVKNAENRFLSFANTRSRIRMTTLYYFAGLHHYLVVGTGNKVEDFGVGFSAVLGTHSP